MGQNLTLNIAEKGFPLSIYNRITSKVDETVDRVFERFHPRDLNDSIISTLNSTLASQNNSNQAMVRTFTD
ncbi:hypothetical protein UlMin_013326 [Ulmus minor]